MILICTGIMLAALGFGIGFALGYKASETDINQADKEQRDEAQTRG